MADPFRTALDAIPVGASEGWYAGRRWRVRKSVHASGRGVKLWAEAADGSDRISLNHYRLAAGDRLRPCEMAEEKVRAFVLGLQTGRAGTP